MGIAKLAIGPILAVPKLCDWAAMLSANRNTYRSVYAAHDLTVVAGVNGGENADHASDSFAGDIYQLAPHAARLDVSTGDEPPENALAYDLYLDGRFGPERPSSTFLGHLGRDLLPVSHLRMMGPSGDLVEVLTLTNPAPHPERGQVFAGTTFFMPLAPMKVGVEYTLLDTSDEAELPGATPEFEGRFGTGTHIRLADGGDILVELLRPGMMLVDPDGREAEVLDIRHEAVDGAGADAPVLLPKGLFDTEADLILSPRQPILISDWRAEVMLGAKEVALKAGDLVGDNGITRQRGGTREMFDILTAEPFVVLADGQACPLPGQNPINDATAPNPAEIQGFLRQSGILAREN